MTVGPNSVQLAVGISAESQQVRQVGQLATPGPGPPPPPRYEAYQCDHDTCPLSAPGAPHPTRRCYKTGPLRAAARVRRALAAASPPLSSTPTPSCKAIDKLIS
uniref:Uncharacterized protein n=1 Tax=Leersia perrieri TaxID=77586 RepID=A0A0D9VTP6_9ORYZ